MSRAAIWPWLRPFLILVCVVAAPLVIYFLGYVQHSLATHRQRSFVTLSAVATDLSARLIAYNSIAERAGFFHADNTEDLKNYLGTIMRTKRFEVPAPRTDKAIPSHLDLDADGAGLALNVACTVENDDSCSSQRPIRLTAFVRLEELVAWDMVQTDFDGVLVLDRQGQLVAQDRRLPAQPLAVPVKLTLGGGVFNVGAFFAATASSAQSKATTSGDADALLSPLSFRDEVVLQIAGVDYVAFLQPLRIPTTAVGGGALQVKGKPLDMVMCGLVRQDRMRSEALALSPSTLVFVSAIVAFGLFAIPFLKLRFIGPRERMRRRDVWLLACAALCATALGTLLILERHTVNALQDRFDQGLIGFTSDVVQKSDDERRLAVAQLYASAPELLSGYSQPSMKQPVAGVLGAKFNKELTYPSFEALYAVNLDRTQELKWMPRTVPTAMVVAQVDIVDALSLGLSQDSRADTATGTQSAAFQTVVATTTGLLLGAFAIPASSKSLEVGSAVKLPERNKIAILATPFASLNEPLVAAPFQFVVVDQVTRQIVMKSAAGPFRDERFFDSVRNGAALQRSAQPEVTDDKTRVLHKTATLGSYEYRGTKYRMHAVNLPELHATLVGYYEQNIVESLGARMLVGGALFALGIIASVLIGAVIAYCWLRERAFDWAWPSSAFTGRYFLGIIACVVIGTIVMVVYSRFAARAAPSVFAWFLLSMPGIAVIAVSGITHECKVTLLRLRLQRAANWLVAHAGADAWMFKAFAVVAVLTLVALPTLIAFNDVATLYRAAYGNSIASTYDSDAGRRLRLLKAGVVQDDAANSEALCSGSREKPTDTGAKKPAAYATVDARCAMLDRERVYASPGNYKLLLGEQAKYAVYNDCIRIDSLKIADVTSEKQYCALQRPAVLALPWSFTLSALHRLPMLTDSNASLAGSLAGLAAAEDSDGKSHGVFEGFTFSEWNSGGFLLLLVGLSLLVGSVARNVLGLGLAGDGVLPRQDEFKPANATRWLLLRPATADVTKALGGCEPKTVDLRNPALQHGDLPVADANADTATAEDANTVSTLLLMHVECRLTDRNWRNALLKVLAMPRSGCLVLVSEIDPLHFLAQQLRETIALANTFGEKDQDLRKPLDSECGKLRDELVRWAIALHGVEKIRRAPLAFPADVPRKITVDLYEKIAAECQWSEPLIQIGARLVARADLAHYRWRQIVGFIGDAAEPYYRSQWDLCSRDEKLVMLQLAQEGVVNPKSIDLVMRLARRRLLVVDPRFCIMNESFGAFVRAAELPEHVVQWEHAGHGTTWSRLQTPIYALAIVVVAILLYTEQGLASSIVALATGAAGKLGSLRKLYAAINPSSQMVA